MRVEFTMDAPSIQFNSYCPELSDEWHVIATYPRGQEEHITGFKNKTEAQDWIAKHSRAWLKMRGYLGA